jgi:PAS domain S-box-containing protein
MSDSTPRGRLFRKYVVVLLLLVGGVLMVSSIVELYFSYQETKRAIVRVERAKAVAVAARIEQFVKDIERQVRETTQAASDDPAAAQVGRGKLAFRTGLGTALAEQRELDFLRLLRNVPAVSEVRHLDVAGREQLRVSRLEPDAIGSQEDFSRAPKFLEARSGKTYVSPVYLRNDSEPHMTLAVPVGTYAVEVTAAEINLKSVLKLIAQIEVGPKGYAYVVDSRGRLFAHPDIRLVHQLRDLSALPQVRSARAAGSSASEDDSGGIVADGLQGGQVLAAHAAIAPLGWLVLVERPLADAYAPLRAPIIRSAVIFVLGLLLSVLASLVLARRMVAPIRVLQAGAARIGAGDLGHRIEVRTGDELEALGEQFNRTAAQLQESYANLEEKVAVRTRQLAETNAGLTEALQQQTATGEILRVISSSPTDVQPVFDTIAESAARLCEAEFCHVFRFDGELLHFVAHHGLTPEGIEAARGAFPTAPDRGSAAGRSILSAAVAHIPDVHADPDYALGALASVITFRSTVAVPMVREGLPIGAIAVLRCQAGPFSNRQIALLQTFADQAVIAIENVRLFKELEARNREMTETLEQQTATGEILRVISSSPTDVQPVFETIAHSAARLCEAADAHIWQREGDRGRVVASYGAWPLAREEFIISRLSVVGRAMSDRRAVHVEDLAENCHEEFPGSRGMKELGYRTILAMPLLREGEPIGAIMIRRTEVRPFSNGQVALLGTFADQAVIAIENVRLFKELEARNAELTETVAAQTATGEVLRAISRAQTDAQPVFDIIAASALRLCGGAGYGQVVLYHRERLYLAAFDNANPEGVEALRRRFPARLDHGSAVGRAVLTRAVVQIPDVLEDPAYTFKSELVTMGVRSILVVPMLRTGEPIGAIAVGRPEHGPFTDKEIELLETFADQAVIAIENVRLFQELEARTRDLTRSVGELRALGEVSQAVSSTLDLETVLATIVSRAVQLSGSHGGIVYEFDETVQRFHARATHQVTPEHLETLRAVPIRLGEGAVGRAGVSREPVQVADIEEDWQLVAPQVRAIHAREGTRSLLAVPLVREERLLGGLVILRRERGAFSPEVVATLQTFAAQSVLAIHNARLFRETQRQKQYSEALVETSPVAIATMDLRGTVVGWNPGAERLFGYTQAEALGRHMEDLVATPEVREEVRANIRQTLEGEWIRAIARRARKDGTLVDVEISSMPVIVDGAKVGMIGIYHDITELLRARREAEAANEAKSAFLATMSHEIRTPMNAVIGMSGLLLNTALTDEQREYAEVVRESGDTLLTVINDILDFSKIEAGKLELESQPFDLRECVESALDLVATRAADKGLDLAYLIGDGTPAGILGDVTRLRQVLLNLLSNAVKFTERGEVVLSVSARGLDGGAPLHELTFTVRDTGIGIAPDRLGRLFQSFSQVDASTTRRYGGTGLGLAISQRLTDLMGGRISVTSEVGRGSEFRVTIQAPAAPVSVSAHRDLSGVQPSLRDKLVLVVDDNATNRRILTAHLDAWGMRARATGSPAETIAWIRGGEQFDVGILDMHMPEMDGVTLARAIREHPAGAALPLVLFTSLGRREARVESEGFAAYLHKPIKPSQLFDALVSVLAERPVHVRERGAARREFDPEMARRHPLRILLAEDNIVNQKVALRLLGQLGYRVDVAANGLEAIDAVERQAYDVILMDVQMPELDGFEASREINRRWPGEHRPRIVAMTANAMQGDRELCAAAGMDDYVAKPIRGEELIAALERCRWRTEVGDHVPGHLSHSLGSPSAFSESELASPGGSGSHSAAAPHAAPGPAQAPLVAGPLRADPLDGSHSLAMRSVDLEGAPASTAIDRAVFERLTAAMGGEFVAELADTFVEDGRDLIAALRRALTEVDLEAFRRAAHSLKSNSETLGATGLAILARELEAMARAGSLDGAEDRFEPLVRGYEVAVRALGELRRGLTA